MWEGGGLWEEMRELKRHGWYCDWRCKRLRLDLIVFYSVIGSFDDGGMMYSVVTLRFDIFIAYLSSFGTASGV